MESVMKSILPAVTALALVMPLASIAQAPPSVARGVIVSVDNKL
jgi:hypothetical protein